MSVFQFRHVSMGLALIVGITAGAVAGPAEKAQIKPRQDKLRDMGGALKAITDELKKPKVDWDNTIILNAQTIKDRSAYLLNWFPKGSGPEAGVKTYALPAIWQKTDDFTKLGKAMRATFQDQDTASLMGVNIQFIYMATFAMGSSLAAAAGALLGPVYVISPQMGNLASLKAFAIVILGGLGSIGGATIGGFVLAFAEELGAGYISSGYRDAMGFLLIIAVLLFKPTGLLARSERIG